MLISTSVGQTGSGGGSVGSTGTSGSGGGGGSWGHAGLGAATVARQVKTGAPAALSHVVGDVPGQMRSMRTEPVEMSGRAGWSGSGSLGSVTTTVRRTQRREPWAYGLAGPATSQS